jgi:tRNA pseudouridine55 synthase
MMNGVLVVDKPKGPTSSDVVQIVRRALKVKKVGHTGTLDPMATGVLPLCLGEATKVAQILTDGSKAYDATVKLGVSTKTLDAEGEVSRTAVVPSLTREAIEQVLERFRGAFLQTPPMYSAVKKDGKRLYELARAGESIERDARPVTVHRLVLNDFSSDELRISVACSKGFFVRTLASDIGDALGCGAHLCALRRTQAGPFTLNQASSLAQLQKEGPEAARSRLVSLEEAVSFLPVVRVSASDVQRVMHGVLIEVGHVDAPEVRVVGPDGRLLALAEVRHGRLRYKRVFGAAEGE